LAFSWDEKILSPAFFSEALPAGGAPLRRDASVWGGLILKRG
jgi:hypothetical protein